MIVTNPVLSTHPNELDHWVDSVLISYGEMLLAIDQVVGMMIRAFVTIQSLVAGRSFDPLGSIAKRVRQEIGPTLL